MNNPDLYARMFEVVRPLINQQDIVDQKDESLEFNFIDPIHGRIKLRLYEYNGAAVLTSWENSAMGSICYAQGAAENFNFFKNEVTKYLSDPFSFYESGMLESWRQIEDILGAFVRKYGNHQLTSKILKIQFFTEDEKIKLLSYLSLQENIRAAREREAAWEINREFFAKKETQDA